MFRRLISPAVLLTLVLALGAGCGGGDNKGVIKPADEGTPSPKQVADPPPKNKSKESE